MQDLFSIGVTALGPRKKIIHALSGLRKDNKKEVDTDPANSKFVVDDSSKIAANKLITDFFPGFVAQKRNRNSTPSGRNEVEKSRSSSRNGRSAVKNNARKGKQLRDIPVWCCIPETPFRVVNCPQTVRGIFFRTFKDHFLVYIIIIVLIIYVTRYFVHKHYYFVPSQNILI